MTQTRKIAALTGDAVTAKADMLAELCAAVFDDFDSAYLSERLPNLVSPVLHLMTGEEEHALGFKLGYQRSPSLLYSWLGGVIPRARRQDIAGELMRAQHAWARAHHYTHIETRTRAANNAMIIRNLKSGFSITGHEIDSAGCAIVIQRIALV